MPISSAAAYVPSFIFSAARNLTRAARNVGGGQRPVQYRRFYDGEGGRTESIVSRLFKRFGTTKLAAVPAGLTVISQSATQANAMARQESGIPDAPSTSTAPLASTSSAKSPAPAKRKSMAAGVHSAVLPALTSSVKLPEPAKMKSMAPAMDSAVPTASTSSARSSAPIKTKFVVPAVRVTEFGKPDKTMPLIRSNDPITTSRIRSTDPITTPLIRSTDPVMLAALEKLRNNAKRAGADSAPAPIPDQNKSSWLVRTTLAPRALARTAAAKTD